MDSQGSTPKQQVAERLRQGQNIVVTVSQQPAVDEVAAAIGLTRLLDSFGKKVTAIISSPTPAVLDFLNANGLISHNVDRLRDFVIELDKDKADKLRYKAEDEVVKVFITPYQSVITEKDLRFSQGDYNVDTVVIIGATTREKVDEVLIDHSRIMHDATVVTINAGEKAPSMGAINWHEPEASSVGEMLVSISDALQPGLMDAPAAQALLSSIVSATDGFKNKATTPKVMTMAAQLMASGADQQVVMSHFETPVVTEKPTIDQDQSQPSDSEKSTESKTTLSIKHEPKETQTEKKLNKLKDAKPSQETTKQTSEEPKLTITPEVKPAQPLGVEEKPAKKMGGTATGSASDSELAADAIDAMIESARKVNEQMDAERRKTEEPAVDVPILKHDADEAPKAKDESRQLPKIEPAPVAKSEPHINLHPETPVLKPAPQPADSHKLSPAVPAQPSSGPQTPKTQPTAAESNGYGQDERNKAVSEALKAVEQARAAKPPEIREPLQALSSETLANEANISIDHTGQLSHNQIDQNQ